MKPRCPFCNPDLDRVFHEETLVLGLWDGYPVSTGHALLVPRRHFATWFEATPDEQQALFKALHVAKELVDKEYSPDGFNIGINVNESAGQTVSHMHVHLIPRYRGDVPDPTGGVRNVIPAKGNYLLKHASHGNLIRGEGDPLLPRLLSDLERSENADLAVAFIKRSGVNLVYEHLRERLERGGYIRLLTGDYLDVTDPDAMHQLLDLRETVAAGSFHFRVFQAGETSFHPKAYVFYNLQGDGYAYIGSSNLTSSALRRGVEWNFRVDSSSSPDAFEEIRRGFDELFEHPCTRPVDLDWIEEYRQRRKPDLVAWPVDVALDPEPEVPVPHDVQREALEALVQTREDGNSAGLVVLATGLGKTWLSAFDSNRRDFKRILFVAHREEILTQAFRTFRRIRPRARLGKYTGTQKDDTAEVLFASIQTLSRAKHLKVFRRDHFDYVIVDEFHHAAAKTYRRLIDYFDPRFLLGLTATPERTDGGDLLALCQENLVYRCDFVEGIRKGHLSAFRYFGVPDDVNYKNIPWRSSRFDEEALTEAVATQKRAQNILGEYRRRGGKRTLGFCCSQKHSDFMSDYFRAHDIDAVSVHSGPSSAPRTASLEKLEKGEIGVVFSVDLFNEGVDLPAVDTVLMLRPTESSILWTQQFGRGLRKAEGKPYLNVIDYIGNHRTFLVKIRSMLEPLLQGQLIGDAQISHALQQVIGGEIELPPECGVTYDLVSIDLIRSILRKPKGAEAVETVYRDFRDRTGQRATAVELYHEGYDPKAVRKSFGSWFSFVDRMGDLAETEASVVQEMSDLLGHLEITPMTKSYKMLVLLAMLNLDRLPGEITIDALTAEFRRLAERSARLRKDVGPPIENDGDLQSHIEKNPINAWIGGWGTGKRTYFSYENEVLRTSFQVPEVQRAAFQELVRELVDWRLAKYLDRGGDSPSKGEFVGMVKHANSRPMIFLPDRKEKAGIPLGRTRLLVNGLEHQANFAKIALDSVTKPDSDTNVLPQILRGWFGPDTGLPGTTHSVLFSSVEAGWCMTPRNHKRDSLLEQWRVYSREEIPSLFGLEFNPGKWNQGFVTILGHAFLLVTLEKSDMQSDHRYSDHFESRDIFVWQSQNQTGQDSKNGRLLSRHNDEGYLIHLFVRKTKKLANRAAPFLYCGNVEFISWEGEKPITINWKLHTPVPTSVQDRLGIR